MKSIKNTNKNKCKTIKVSIYIIDKPIKTYEFVNNYKGEGAALKLYNQTVKKLAIESDIENADRAKFYTTLTHNYYVNGNVKVELKYL